MSDNYDVSELDLWYLNTSPIPKKERSQVNNRVFALYLCDKCEHIWEISTTGSILRYKHLPKYGKIKKTCRFCINGHNKTYKEK